MASPLHRSVHKFPVVPLLLIWGIKIPPNLYRLVVYLVSLNPILSLHISPSIFFACNTSVGIPSGYASQRIPVMQFEHDKQYGVLSITVSTFLYIDRHILLLFLEHLRHFYLNICFRKRFKSILHLIRIIRNFRYI